MLPFPKTRNELATSLSVARRRTVPWNRPSRVFLEVTNRCNLACVMCGRTHDKRYKDESFTGDISFELVKKLESFYRPATFVTATGLGEPFLNPDMTAILAYLKSRGAAVSMTSNGTLLSEEIARELLEIQLDRIVFSIDSPDEKTFRRIRVGARLDDVLFNIERLARLKSSSGAAKPYLILEFVAMAQNFHQLPEVADLAARLGFDEVIVQNLFKAFDPGYNVFYQRNKLSALDPGRALALWRDFTERLDRRRIRLYSPFAGGAIGNYLGAAAEKGRRALKSSDGFVGSIDAPAAMALLDGRFTASGWAMGRQGVPAAELTIENATQTKNCTLRLDQHRPDVPPHLPERYPAEPICGFSQTIDLSDVEGGVASLSLRVADRLGQTWKTLERRQVLIATQENYRMYCTQPWSTVYVTWDGKVRTCCFHELVLGDLTSEPIERIWTGETYRRLREKVAGGQVIPECLDCLAGKSNPNYVRSLGSWLRPRRFSKIRRP